MEKRVARLEAEILKLEEDQAKVTEQLGSPSAYSDKNKAKELNIESARLSKRLQEKNQEWEAAAEELSQLL